MVDAGTDPIISDSSEDTVTFGADSFFFNFLDARRNTCLFAECRGPLGFMDISDDNDRTFSEKVRLMPASGSAFCAPGIYVKLAERERPFVTSSSLVRLGGRGDNEWTGLRTWAGTAGKQSTSAPVENIAGESSSHWRRGEGIELLSRHGAGRYLAGLAVRKSSEPCSRRTLTCLGVGSERLLSSRESEWFCCSACVVWNEGSARGRTNVCEQQEREYTIN
jgi:hypothetical protein